MHALVALACAAFIWLSRLLRLLRLLRLWAMILFENDVVVLWPPNKVV